MYQGIILCLQTNNHVIVDLLGMSGSCYLFHIKVHASRHAVAVKVVVTRKAYPSARHVFQRFQNIPNSWPMHRCLQHQHQTLHQIQTCNL